MTVATRTVLTTLASMAGFTIGAALLSAGAAYVAVPRVESWLHARRAEGATISDWQRYAAGGQQFNAPAGVPRAVTIVEFSDFECPFCRVVAGELRQVQDSYGGRVGIVYRYYPLNKIHPHAALAAVAATCAAQQNQFDAMHDLLFDMQDSLGAIAWSRLAREAGVPDSSGFAACMTGQPARARVRADIALGKRLDINGTPTLLVNGFRIDGVPPRGMLDSLVLVALHRTTVARR